MNDLKLHERASFDRLSLDGASKQLTEIPLVILVLLGTYSTSLRRWSPNCYLQFDNCPRVRGAQVDPCQVVEKKVTPRLALLAPKKLWFTRNMLLSLHGKINELRATYVRAMHIPKNTLLETFVLRISFNSRDLPCRRNNH
jgi:hypothetical protein